MTAFSPELSSKDTRPPEDGNIPGFGDRIRILMLLGRPRTCGPGTIAYALGFSYTGIEPGPTFVLGALLSFLISFSANLHNSLSDRVEDAINLPGRALLLDRLGVAFLRRLLWIMTTAMVLASTLVSGWFLLAMIGAVIGLHQYSFPPMRGKKNPVLGLIIFAQAVGFPFILGLGTAPDGPVGWFYQGFVQPVLNGTLPLVWSALDSNRYAGMFLFVVAWFIAKGFFKNVPDYVGDQQAGLLTSATIFANRRVAAVTAKWITLCAYVSLFGLVLLRLEEPLILWSLVLWMPLVYWNSNRLVAAEDPADGNQVLRADMSISTYFIATLLLLVDPAWHNAAVVLVVLAVLYLADRFSIDSRRAADLDGQLQR